jgi:hypothetical protein
LEFDCVRHFAAASIPWAMMPSTTRAGDRIYFFNCCTTDMKTSRKSNVVTMDNYRRAKRTGLRKSRPDVTWHRHLARSTKRSYGNVLLASLFAVFAGWIVFEIASKPWPLTLSLRHFASYPNCNAARAMGLAPARSGQPGYYQKHDRDRDGIACEPYRRW